MLAVFKSSIFWKIFVKSAAKQLQRLQKMTKRLPAVVLIVELGKNDYLLVKLACNR